MTVCAVGIGGRRKSGPHTTPSVQSILRRKDVARFSTGLDPLQQRTVQSVRYKICSHTNVAPAVWSTSTDPTADLQDAVQLDDYLAWGAQMFKTEVANHEIDGSRRERYGVTLVDNHRSVETRVRQDSAVRVDSNDFSDLSPQIAKIPAVGHRIVRRVLPAAGSKIQYSHFRTCEGIYPSVELNVAIDTSIPPCPYLGVKFVGKGQGSKSSGLSQRD